MRRARKKRQGLRKKKRGSGPVVSRDNGLLKHLSQLTMNHGVPRGAIRPAQRGL